MSEARLLHAMRSARLHQKISPRKSRVGENQSADFDLVSHHRERLQPSRLPLQFRVKGNGLVHDGDGWETISSDEHFSNDHLTVATERVRTPARSNLCTWTVVRRKAAVIVAPMTRENKIVLIRQERIPIRTAIWEMPAGQIDSAEGSDAEIRETALRELREETGYELAQGGELIALGHYFSSPGFTDEHGYLFFARAVQQAGDDNTPDDTESILDCREFSAGEIWRMIAENEIRDANTLGICARLAARGFLSLDSKLSD
jgi:8-oxo-dGTP pyrophosphatase MutT (NUDIX family)